MKVFQCTFLQKKQNLNWTGVQHSFHIWIAHGIDESRSDLCGVCWISRIRESNYHSLLWRILSKPFHHSLFYLCWIKLTVTWLMLMKFHFIHSDTVKNRCCSLVQWCQFTGDKQEVRSPESSWNDSSEKNQNGYCLLMPFSLRHFSVQRRNLPLSILQTYFWRTLRGFPFWTRLIKTKSWK